MLSRALPHNEHVAKKPHVLVSTTTIDHLTEHALEQFSLRPMSSFPVSPNNSSNSNDKSSTKKRSVLKVQHDMTKHSIHAMSLDNLWFEHKNEHHALALPVLVSCARHSHEKFMKFQLVPFLQYDMSSDVASVSVLSCTSFMRVVGFDQWCEPVSYMRRSTQSSCRQLDVID